MAHRGFTLAFCLGALVVTASGCRCERPGSGSQQADDTADSGAAEAASIAPRCRGVGDGAFTAGDPGDYEPDGGPLDIPFSPELGSAAGVSDGFVVSLLLHRDAAAHAAVCFVAAAGGEGTLLDLGTVHGAAGAPRLAGTPRGVVLAIADADASGPLLRLARWARGPAGKGMEWGAHVSLGWQSTGEFDVAASGDAGLLVWRGAQSPQGEVRLAPFSLDRLKQPPTSHHLSALGGDPEALRLVARPGGFWLVALQRSGSRPEPSGGAGRAPGPEWDGSDGAARVVALALDEQGTPMGAAIRVAETRGVVLAYDVAAAPDGGLALAWLDGADTPGASAGGVMLARVGADGSVQRVPWPGLEVGGGVPTLLLGRPGQPDWVALYGRGEPTVSLAGWQQRGGAPRVSVEPALKAGQVLARRDDRVLAAMPRGTALDLHVLSCVSESGHAPHERSR